MRTLAELMKVLIDNPQMSKDEVEAALHELAGAEVASGNYDADTMATAYSESGGDEEATVTRYVELRVEQLGEHLIKSIEETVRDSLRAAEREQREE